MYSVEASSSPTEKKKIALIEERRGAVKAREKGDRQYARVQVALSR
jgi:hypothetical protein